MNARTAAVAGLGCVLVGVAAVRLILSSPAGEGDRGARRLAAENRALKNRLDALQAERTPFPEPGDSRIATGTSQAAPESDPTLPPPAQDASEELIRTFLGRFMNGTTAAKLMGLEGGRRRQFEDVYARVLSKLQEAESRHAVVSRRGRDVEIHIPPFPAEGALLRQEWSGLLMTALTPQELERYEELQLDQILFPREFGAWDRYMVFQPEDSVWPKVANGRRHWPTFFERWTKPGEEEIDASTRWPWGGPDAYRCYRHLLDPDEVRVREE